VKNGLTLHVFVNFTKEDAQGNLIEEDLKEEEE
jgi:hypothetical protein